MQPVILSDNTETTEGMHATLTENAKGIFVRSACAIITAVSDVASKAIPKIIFYPYSPLRCNIYTGPSLYLALPVNLNPQ